MQGPQGPAGPQGIQGPQGPAGLLTNGTSAGNTPYWDGSTWVVNSNNIFNNGGNVGIGNPSPGQKLSVTGSVQSSALAGSSNRIVRSDAAGVLTNTLNACPTIGFAIQSATVDFTWYRLCIYAEDFNSNWNTKSSDCNQFYQGAKVCTHQQIRAACLGSGGTFAPIANKWLADRPADDTGLHTNGTDCNNFDGASAVGTSFGVYCCIEMPK